MAARLTDKKKKKIVADYLELGSYNAVAKRNHVCGETARRVVEASEDFAEKLRQKKEENTADILAYMESRRQAVCDIIEDFPFFQRRFRMHAAPQRLRQRLGH